MTQTKKAPFDTARQNMVDCQIRPNGVFEPTIINAFETIPREIFAPEQSKDIAYMDEDLAIGGGRYMIEPRAHAKMLNALDITPQDVVLDIGGATGYSAAILSQICQTVIAVEQDQALLDLAQTHWDTLDIGNIASYQGDHAAGDNAHAPFDKIFIGGACPDIPHPLTEQLRPDGKMVFVLKEEGHRMGFATLVQRSKTGHISSKQLFEVTCPLLIGFSAPTAFSF